MSGTKDSVWDVLSRINVNQHTEKKNNLTYLSWAWAWTQVKNAFPSARFTKHTFEGRPYMIDEKGYAFVSVTVQIEEEAQTELLPVLDHRNKSIVNPDSFAVNTALQRCLAKCCATHGLGMYIYAGEDLPQEESQPVKPPAKKLPPKREAELDQRVDELLPEPMVPAFSEGNKVTGNYIGAVKDAWKKMHPDGTLDHWRAFCFHCCKREFDITKVREWTMDDLISVDNAIEMEPADQPF